MEIQVQGEDVIRNLARNFSEKVGDLEIQVAMLTTEKEVLLKEVERLRQEVENLTVPSED